MKKTIITVGGALLFSNLIFAQSINIQNGWQLKGTSEDINITSLNNSCIDYIWKYDSTDISNLKWQLHIANGQNYNYNGESISSLNKDDGFWIKGNNNCIINTEHNNTNFIFQVFRTGQTISYDNNGNENQDIKDDGFYKKGLDKNYTRNDINNIVTDNITGLVWEDTVQNTTYKTYNESKSYCQSLDIANITNWRLPSIYELSTLVDYSKGSSSTGWALNSIFDNKAIYSDRTWSSNVHLMYDSNESYFIDFSDASMGSFSTVLWNGDEPEGDVRCVSGNKINETTNMQIINNSIIDNDTNLMWQDNEEVKTNQTYNFENAISYCENLTLNGYENWRLPNINEFLTIIDVNMSSYIKIDFNYFPNTYSDDGIYSYWTSTSRKEYEQGVYVIHFGAHGFGTGNDNKINDNGYLIECVRDTLE